MSRITFHAFAPEDIDFALGTGIPIPAACGRWMPVGIRLADRGARGERHICRNCQRVARARGKEIRIPIPEEAR